ncbi:hypothetical protein MKK64_17490 [Methylobacterium sp. E-025]|uniref:hypothetical protein n=1 Tax=Methylobacterium sp. E-025 TaxID=2836561 RepID=UPI001FBABD10|nr:hypothetical protein [Methylobacterium sp. E-025]MCJ2112977.1 hypothetical protein [Methylobacterium sp. E-025]
MAPVQHQGVQQEGVEQAADAVDPRLCHRPEQWADRGEEQARSRRANAPASVDEAIMVSCAHEEASRTVERCEVVAD